MTFFSLATAVDEEDAVVDFAGRRDRLIDFFVLGGDGRFLSFMTPRARAHDGRWTRDIGGLDFVSATSPIPLFSARFRDAVGADLEGDVEFHECIVEAGGGEHVFYAGRIHRRLDLVDPEASSARSLTDGTRSLTELVFRDPSRADFLLARDREEEFALIASGAFRSLCETRGLRVGFVPYSAGRGAG